MMSIGEVAIMMRDEVGGSYVKVKGGLMGIGEVEGHIHDENLKSGVENAEKVGGGGSSVRI